MSTHLRRPGATPRTRLLRSPQLSWGFVSQASSSATSLLLTIAVARLLGPSSLGAVAIGFTGYLVLLGIQRVLVVQPLIASSSASSSKEAHELSRSGLTVSLAGALALVGAMAGVGFALDGTAGHGLLLFAPWTPAALLQDFWRSLLFRDSRGAAAASNDLVWLVTTAAALAGAWAVGTEWALVAAWGLGALVAAAVGFGQLRLSPAALTAAYRRWHSDLWPFGRWLLGGSAIYNAGAQGSVFVIGGMLGPSALGGVRAVQTIFAPLTLLSPAVALPALPAMVRRLAADPADARALAWRVNGLLLVLTGFYVILAALLGDDLLSLVFGVSFEGYGDLIVPIAAQQLIAACGLGFDLLLQAGQQGRALFVAYAISVPIGLVLLAVTAATGDIVAAAWGLAAGRLVSVIIIALFALSWARRETTAAASSLRNGFDDDASARSTQARASWRESPRNSRNG